ncbi:MAG: molybdopterin-dependent oxidoreductase [Pirellulaceae bacterium]|nr:molybdopterin-dependent oxidoreductase [Pirellulaceae bacterium]
MKTILSSVCALDCPDACLLKITVEDGRVVKFQGDDQHPYTQGFACVKTVHYPERQERADRLLTPLRRVGPKGSGKFEPISWDDALDQIADRLRSILQSDGPQSVLPYCYSGTLGQVEGAHALALFRGLGALELDQTICATTGSEGWERNYGPNKLGPDPEDVIHSRCILLWGINAVRSNSHLIPFLKEAKRRGATIVHIDPYRNETSRLADEHWQIRVGTDAALALAIGGEILKRGWHDAKFLQQFADGVDEYRLACDEWPLEKAAVYCGLPLDRLEAITELFAKSTSSFIRVGYGMTRNEGGGNAMRAISLLPSLIGAWKNLGGGALLSTSGAFPLNRSKLGGRHLIRPETRHVNMNCLASELERSDKPLKALFVFNSNPAAVAPDSSRIRKGLAREDLLTIVLEHFQTDTADYADFLLPATTFLEHADLYTAYGHYYLQWAEPVVPPRGQTRSNTHIFADLAKRLGLTDESLYWTAEQVARQLLDTQHPYLSGITLNRLKEERSIKIRLPKPFLPYSTGSNFEDGRIRFSPPPTQLTFEEQPSIEFPFRLISPPGAFIVNTTMGNIESLLKASGGEPQIIIHHNDAIKLGIQTGDHVRIVSRQGSIVRQAKIGGEALPGVVIALGQWWPKLSPDRKGLNDLTSERLTDLGGGSTFGNVVVRLEANPT